MKNIKYLHRSFTTKLENTVEVLLAAAIAMVVVWVGKLASRTTNTTWYTARVAAGMNITDLG